MASALADKPSISGVPAAKWSRGWACSPRCTPARSTSAASPLSGMGTSLALVGAYVLAGELGLADSLAANAMQAALQRYESVIRPYIDRCQDLPNGIDGYLPKSASDIAVTAAVMKVDAALALSFRRRAKVVHHADAIDLPDY
jgi:2-polyprenyl-6-methoxyphenol hydroxylase-like FAD-dependent oxidoreductase